jgi:hypothetical protein
MEGPLKNIFQPNQRKEIRKMDAWVGQSTERVLATAAVLFFDGTK